MKRYILLLLFVVTTGVSAANIDKYINKNEISFRGKSDPAVQVDIYVNDKVQKTVQADENGDWYAEGVAIRKDGENSIYAIAKSDDGSKSKLSSRLTVFVDKVPPKVTLAEASPKSVKPGEEIAVKVKGDTDITGVTAVMPDSSSITLQKEGQVWVGSWIVPRLLAGGAYPVLVSAVDRAGNVTQKNTNEVQIDAVASLVITEPEDNVLVYDLSIPVKGVAKSSAYVLINGAKAPVDVEGNFSGLASIQKPGRSQIVVKAFSYNGMAFEKTLDVVRLITFRDIQTHWAKQPIEFMATLGYVDAYPQSSLFLPDNSLSRAELATILVRTKQFPVSYAGLAKPSFRDVANNSWAVNYIETASRYNIVEGYPGQIFKPNNMITRAEAVAMIVRFAGIPVMNVERAGDIDVGVKHWASSYIAAFKAAGLMPTQWQQQQRFYPNQPITRAEMCAILARVSEINREIELLIGRKTNWDYAIDNSYYVRQSKNQAEGPMPQAMPGQPLQPEKGLLAGVVTPREVGFGGVIQLSVATVVKVRSVSALYPDAQEQPLVYNAQKDVWEGSWTVPATMRSGGATVQLKAIDLNGQDITAESNVFTVYLDRPHVDQARPVAAEPVYNYQDESVAPPVPAPAPQYDQTPVAPPAPVAAASVTSVPATTKAAPLTRAQLTVLLAKYGKIKTAKIVNVAPALDVPVTHPQVKTIKAAIVSGIVPNLAGSKFYPNRKVTKAEAAAVLRKANIVARYGKTDSKDYITEAEFDNWLSQKVQ